MARKILRFPLVRLVLGFAWMFIWLVVAQTPVVLLPQTQPVLILLGVIVGAGLALAGYYAFARWYEGRRPVAELALAPAPREFGLGLAWGTGLFTLTFVLMLLFGVYVITGAGNWVGVILILAISVVSGVVEELIFRAVFYRIVQEWLGTWVALVASALLFGAVHLGNPNATLVAGLAIALEAGILLALAYQATGRVWLPIGLHLAWNFVQGGVFGVPISGIDVGGMVGGVLASEPRGPELLSGGSFGAEASVFAMVVCLAGAGYFLWRVVRAGKVVPPFWVKRAPAASAATPAAP